MSGDFKVERDKLAFLGAIHGDLSIHKSPKWSQKLFEKAIKGVCRWKKASCRVESSRKSREAPEIAETQKLPCTCCLAGHAIAQRQRICKKCLWRVWSSVLVCGIVHILQGAFTKPIPISKTSGIPRDAFVYPASPSCTVPGHVQTSLGDLQTFYAALESTACCS